MRNVPVPLKQWQNICENFSENTRSKADYLKSFHHNPTEESNTKAHKVLGSERNIFKLNMRQAKEKWRCRGGLFYIISLSSATIDHGAQGIYI